MLDVEEASVDVTVVESVSVVDSVDRVEDGEVDSEVLLSVLVTIVPSVLVDVSDVVDSLDVAEVELEVGSVVLISFVVLSLAAVVEADDDAVLVASDEDADGLDDSEVACVDVMLVDDSELVESVDVDVMGSVDVLLSEVVDVEASVLVAELVD